MNPDAGRERKYDSPLRREQQQVTRDRIVEATTELLAEGQPASMAAVAERAGVSERTVYRHFPARTDLLAAVFESVTHLFTGPEEPQSLAALEATVRDMFPRYDRRPEIIRALQMSEVGPEGRAARSARRRAMVQQALADETAALGDAEGRRLEAAVHVLASSTSYLHLRDFWGMEAAESAEVVSWAINALVRAAQAEGEGRGGRRAAVG